MRVGFTHEGVRYTIRPSVIGLIMRQYANPGMNTSSLRANLVEI